MASSETMTSAGERTLSQVESFAYDEKIVRMFLLATVIWGFVGMLVGVIIALQLPSYGRIVPPAPPADTSLGPVPQTVYRFVPTPDVNVAQVVDHSL